MTDAPLTPEQISIRRIMYGESGLFDVTRICDSHDLLRSRLAEVERERDEARAACAEAKEADALREQVAALRKFLTWLSTYEKNPPEVCKDDFAYDRLLAFIQEQARAALATSPQEPTI